MRKTKMVSFRVSPEEYHKIREACTAQGIESASELARVAMHSIIGRHGTSRSIEYQLHELRERVKVLAEDINGLSRQFELGGPASGIQAVGASASD